MENLTPQEVRNRAASALITMADLFKRANVDPSTFLRWEKGENEARPLTKAKLVKALEQVEGDTEQAA